MILECRYRLWGITVAPRMPMATYSMSESATDSNHHCIIIDRDGLKIRELLNWLQSGSLSTMFTNKPISNTIANL